MLSPIEAITCSCNTDLQQVERLREQAQGQIRDGQVDDEDVSRSSHVRVPSHGVAH